MGHADRVAPLESGSSNSDRQLPAAVVEQMQRYVLEVRANGYAAEKPLEAARETLRWYHERLLELLPGPVDFLVALDMTRKRDWALHALIDYDCKAGAKREQLKITDGKPLGICTGGRFPLSVSTKLGLRNTTTRGCLAVFPEAINIGGKKWPPLCPSCQPRTGQRNPYRTARRTLRANVERYLLDWRLANSMDRQGERQ